MRSFVVVLCVDDSVDRFVVAFSLLIFAVGQPWTLFKLGVNLRLKRVLNRHGLLNSLSRRWKRTLMGNFACFFEDKHAVSQLLGYPLDWSHLNWLRWRLQDLVD